MMAFLDLSPKTFYTLIAIDIETALVKYAQIACVFFCKGTRITKATSALKALEQL